MASPLAELASLTHLTVKRRDSTLKPSVTDKGDTMHKTHIRNMAETLSALDVALLKLIADRSKAQAPTTLADLAANLPSSFGGLSVRGPLHEMGDGRASGGAFPRLISAQCYRISSGPEDQVPEYRLTADGMMVLDWYATRPTPASAAWHAQQLRTAALTDPVFSSVAEIADAGNWGLPQARELLMALNGRFEKTQGIDMTRTALTHLIDRLKADDAAYAELLTSGVLPTPPTSSREGQEGPAESPAVPEERAEAEEASQASGVAGATHVLSGLTQGLLAAGFKMMTPAEAHADTLPPIQRRALLALMTAQHEATWEFQDYVRLEDIAHLYLGSQGEGITPAVLERHLALMQRPTDDGPRLVARSLISSSYAGDFNSYELTPHGLEVARVLERERRTPEEVEALKAKWLETDEPEDWDLTAEPGFAAHREELGAFQTAQIEEWARLAGERRAADIAALADDTGLPLSLAESLLTTRGTMQARRKSAEESLAHLYRNAGLTYEDAGADISDLLSRVSEYAAGLAEERVLLTLGKSMKTPAGKRHE